MLLHLETRSSRSQESTLHLQTSLLGSFQTDISVPETHHASVRNVSTSCIASRLRNPRVEGFGNRNSLLVAISLAITRRSQSGSWRVPNGPLRRTRGTSTLPCKPYLQTNAKSCNSHVSPPIAQSLLQTHPNSAADKSEARHTRATTLQRLIRLLHSDIGSHI